MTPRNEGAYRSTQRVALPAGRVPAVGETVTIKFDPNSRRRFVLGMINRLAGAPKS